MAKQYNHINNRIKKFIESQKIFFVATATSDSRINLSPKGIDTFRVVDKSKILWLNLTGSGNETAAHLDKDGRITIMFCSFEGAPMILRLYGKGKIIHPKSEKWSSVKYNFPNLAGTRQIFDIDVDLVQTSCGMSVPLFKYTEERNQLDEWAINKGDGGIKDYWLEKNEFSIDGIPTNIKDGI